MSQDQSKIEYRCIQCDKLPCKCIRNHTALKFETWECCGDTFYTMNKYQEHLSYRHPVPFEYDFDMNKVEKEVYDKLTQPSMNGVHEHE